MEKRKRLISLSQHRIPRAWASRHRVFSSRLPMVTNVFVYGIGGAVFGFVCQQVVTEEVTVLQKAVYLFCQVTFLHAAGLSCFRFLSRKRINFIMLFFMVCIVFINGFMPLSYYRQEAFCKSFLYYFYWWYSMWKAMASRHECCLQAT